MGNIITWLIGIPIILAGAYMLTKSLRNGASGGGCSGCSGCESEDDKGCDH